MSTGATGSRDRRGRTWEKSLRRSPTLGGCSRSRRNASCLGGSPTCIGTAAACSGTSRCASRASSARDERGSRRTAHHLRPVRCLVGSTALGERLDPEEVKLVVGDAIARIVGVIEDLGGHLKDLAGDGVLTFFGAPVAAEDDAERAARAGLRIVEEIAAYAGEVARAWGVEGLAVRVGVATGPVVVALVGGAAGPSTRPSATRSTPRPDSSRRRHRGPC